MEEGKEEKLDDVYSVRRKKYIIFKRRKEEAENL